MKYIVFLSTALGVALLYLLSNASANKAASGDYYLLLVWLNVALAAALVVLIGLQLRHLYRNIRGKVMGSRLNLRLLWSFVLMAIIPGLIVYLVSVNFLTRSIESWFNVKVESALEGGLNLGQTALEIMLTEVKEKGESMGANLSLVPMAQQAATLHDLREKSGISEATLLSPQGRIISVSSSDPSSFLPDLPSVTQLRQARQQVYGNIEPINGKGLYLRVLAPITAQELSGERRILQLLQPVPKSLANTAEAVQDVYQDYQQLSYSRSALRQVFALSLTLVMMLAVLTAVAVAFVLSRRLSAPLAVLAEGTKAIASGNYSTMLPAHGKDELGTLVQSFNSMTQQLGDATKAAERNRERVESARGYLETILSHLSSGVMAFNARGELRTLNQAAVSILDIKSAQFVGLTLAEILAKQTRLEPFLQAISHNMQTETPKPETPPEKQIELASARGKQVLILKGTRLPDSGFVAVFDDITSMVQAQRNAAWGEVARRLAHEIKNPLTPIQLSAERMAHKLAHKLEPADAEVLNRSTLTIVNQVTAMKTMVNEFSEYARAPEPHLENLNLNALIQEVLALYDATHVKITLYLEQNIGLIKGDSTMLRQVLHNMLQNAQDALAQTASPQINIYTALLKKMVVLKIEDNGVGFPADLLDRAFEPYVTSKPHGTGLGLAIVKKMIEEHKGQIMIQNNAQTAHQPAAGATVTIEIPQAKTAA